MQRRISKFQIPVGADGFPFWRHLPLGGRQNSSPKKGRLAVTAFGRAITQKLELQINR
jgi:hypothetical protein